MKRFGAWWANVAELFKEDTTVIGYQLLSEPGLGNYYRSPSLLEAGENDARNLAAVYSFISKKIQSVDPNHLILFSDTYVVPALSHSQFAESLSTHSHAGFKQLPHSTSQNQRYQRKDKQAYQEANLAKEVLAFSYECWYFDEHSSLPVATYRKPCNVFKGEGTLHLLHP